MMIPILIMGLLQGATWLDNLDTSYKKGQITLDEKLEIQMRGIIAPDTLPDEWKKIVAENPLNVRSATPIIMDAFQKSRKSKNPLYPRIPDPMQYYLDSDLYPVRVYYYNEVQHDLAQSVLEGVDEAWAKSIDDFGFYAPPIVTEDGRYPFYIMNASGAAGYTSPVGYYDETPWDDCVTYIVIEENSHGGMVKATVAHELNHASQAAMDCLEPVVFWENTAVFTEIAVYPQIVQWMGYYAEYFQESPWWSISENETPYWYGGFIWPMFLANEYGEGPHDGYYIRDIWERTMQETENVTNVPNYMQVISEKLEEDGSSLNEAFALFTIGRYFVENEANNNMDIIPFAEYITPSVPIQRSLYTDDYSEYEPSESQAPKPYGVNYFRIRQGTKIRNTTIELEDEEGENWQIVYAPMNGSREDIVMIDGTDGKVSMEFDPGQTGDIILAVINKGNDNFNFRSIPHFGTQYKLTVRPTIPYPEISAVLPQSVETGSEKLITIYGSEFQEGAQVSFFPMDGISIVNVEFVNASQLKVTVDTPVDLSTGSRTIIVTNPDEGTADLDGGLTFTQGVPSSSKDDGGCSSSGTRSTSFPTILFVLFGLLFAVRRRIFL
ncbi:IPT/TIG domain-containing protein [Myxococcota bacterium]|nr:IPT/TIG domain-containing protein [Myxococcota bacterium]MBU1379944.1 IPT/TIG domain-containing protein [Myxococcota bacterium]MBU1497070.1 IPT/TIG domain-containing protein [Myxococcota bacterium]